MVSAQLPRNWRSKTKVFQTIPHVIFLIAFVVTVVRVIATIRTETSRQLKADCLTHRCAFVYLVPSNYSNVRKLSSSIASLNKEARFDFKYNIIIAHDGILPVIQGRLQAVSEAPIQFRHFELQSERGILPRNKNNVEHRSPEDVDVDFQDESAQRILDHVHRFWFYTALLNDPAKPSPLGDIDYAVRLDSNWIFTAPIEKDFLYDFVLNAAQYGYHGDIGNKCSENSSEALRYLAKSYIEFNGITPRSKDLWERVVHPQNQICLPYFHPHLEVLNLRFFRSHSGIQDWIRVVDTNGGIYSQGWTDHVLRYITISLYAVPEKIIHYNPKSISYRQIL